MFLKKYYCFLIVVLAVGIYGQSKLKFDFDYAKFNYDSNAVYLEVYYSFNKNSLTQIEEGNIKKVEAVLHIVLQDSITNEYVINRGWKLSETINPANGETKDQVGVLGFVVPKGIYNFEVIGKDSYLEGNEKKVNSVLVVDPYLTNAPKISDIQLATRIITDGADANSIFYKNTLEVIPNAARLFSNNTPVLFYYAELYNLLSSEGVYKLEKLLYNSTGTNFYKKSKLVNSNQNSIVEVGLINLAKYPSDTYNLVLSLIDTTTNSAVVSLKRFYLYNPDVVNDNANQLVASSFIGSEFSVMSEEECDDLFDKSLYIRTSDDNDRYEDLDSLDSKRNFLYNFWKNKDLEPSTPQNEYKREYLLRVDYANKHFYTKLRDGFKSDMGRVYVLFGAPDEREYFPMTQDHKPYEIWYYHQIEGGIEYTFGDITGFGNYELLTSTKRGEVYDASWRNRLKMTNDTGDEFGF